MKQSKLFTKTRKEAPSDEISRNAELLIRGGFIHKEMAGAYMYLPLGLRVLKKIEQIIREEMNAIDGQEISMTALQNPEIFKKTDRWDIPEIWFKTELNNGTKLGLGFSHEEPLVNMLTNYFSSYKDLPVSIYQFQTKFRNELRAKSGILRGREFVMKDMYSFHTSKEDFEAYYERAKVAYTNIFRRVGIGHLTYMTFASGGIFSKYSHEFQTVTSAGEDKIFIDENRAIAVNEEVYTDEVLENLGLDKSTLVEQKSIEVGNIFDLKDKFSKPFNLSFTDDKGESQNILMGCYGIGLGRLMGTIAEVLSDDKGLIWPEAVSPFRVHLLALGESSTVLEEANKIYLTLQENNIEVLFDDRVGLSPGEKFADSDLIGVPLRLVVSERSLKENGIEVKKRTEDKGSIVSLEELLNLLKSNA